MTVTLNEEDFNKLAGELATALKYRGKGGMNALLDKARRHDKKTGQHHHWVAAVNELKTATRWLGRVPRPILSDMQIKGFNACVVRAKEYFENKDA